MAQLQLHRSITFWSGILVIVFIVWAWLDSLNAQSSAMWESCELESHTSALTFIYRPASRRPGWEWIRNLNYSKPAFSVVPPPHFIRGGVDHADLQTRQRYATKYDSLESLWESNAMNMVFKTGRDWLICLPYWLMLAGFMVPWLGLLAWRARRRGRSIMP